MDIIRYQRFNSVDSMTNENNSFPMENAITQNPGQLAKATTTSTVLGLTGRGSAIALFNVTATTGVLTVVDNDEAIKTTGVNLSITTTSTITRASGSFSDDGYNSGDEIFLKGFTNEENNGFFTVDTVGTTTMTVTETSFVTESAASGRSIINMKAKVVDEQTLYFWSFKSWTEYFLADIQEQAQHLVSWSQRLMDATVKLSLTGTANISVGLLFMGELENFGTSKYGSGFEPQDLSVYSTAPSGGFNQTSRPVIQNMNVSLRCSMLKNRRFLRFLDEIGTNKSVFSIKDSTSYQGDLIRFGKITEQPRVTWQKPDSLEYSVQIREEA